MLGRVAALSAQDQGSEARLLNLGLPHRALLPRLDLKLLAPAAQPVPPDSAARDRVILAASTHEGEDGPVLDAFAALRDARPDLRLILAPRHPDRGDAIAALIATRGLSFARRSAGADDAPRAACCWPTPGRDGALVRARRDLHHRGSLQDHGGHTPWEPAAHGCALIHGPMSATSSRPSMRWTGTARRDRGRSGGNPVAADRHARHEARAMGRAARAVLVDRAGDPAALIARLDDLARAPGGPI